MAPAPARSLILDLLSTLRRGTMPVGALVAAGELFGIPGGSVRVALARLLAAGRIARDERGQYRLGSAALPIQQHVSGWRELDRRGVAWDGRWIGVHLPPAGARAQRRRRERALRLLGLEALSPGLFVRPGNLRGGCAHVRDELRRLGLESEAPVFVLADLDPDTQARAQALWDAPALIAGYRASRSDLERSAAALPDLAETEAMVESFTLGGRVLQQLVLDPLLPDPILDTRERDALVDAMRDYDRLGRDCWADFLARYGVPHRQAPADTRMAVGVERLAANI
jgi:phenylacetic acid degradation operon negative regulatory protein